MHHLRDMASELTQYKKIFSQNGNYLEETILSHLRKQGALGAKQEWFYHAIYHNTVNFGSNFAKLSGLIGTDQKFRKSITRLLENENCPIKLRFFGYYLIFNFHNYNKDLSIAKALVETYASVFQNEPMYQITRAIILMQSSNPDDAEEGIRLSHELLYEEAFKDNTGINQTYARSVLVGIEQEIDFICRDKDYFLNKALEHIQKAIAQKQYPKYYFTYGRLHFQLGQSTRDSRSLKRAKRAINRAIDLEDSSRKDYPIRLLEYQSYLVRIEMFLDFLKIENSLNEMNVSIKESVLQLAQQISEQRGISMNEYIENLVKIDTEHYQRHHQL